MSKVALLVGVGEYFYDLAPLPAAAKDVDAIEGVLKDPFVGEFNELKKLINPDRQTMESEIESLFSNRSKDDLVLLYFTGHGISDDSGELHFATSQTRKDSKKGLIRSTAVSASFVHKVMNESGSKRQVVILDCCYSGAFAKGMTAKDAGKINIQKQLGGEGRVVLTSSASTEYSFEQQGSDLSLYTRYLVEGIETGAADLDNDGFVAVDELHDYAKTRVQQIVPTMNPGIHAIKEGFRIFLTQASPSDPLLHYRREVQRFTNRGEISDVARTALDKLRQKLKLDAMTAAKIEEEVLRPSREHHQNLRQYEQKFFEVVWREYPLSESTANDLRYLQRVLGLRDEDVKPIESRVLSRKAAMQEQATAGHKQSINEILPASSSSDKTTQASPASFSNTSLNLQKTSKPRTKFRTRHRTSPFLRWVLPTMIFGSAVGLGGYFLVSWQNTQQTQEIIDNAIQKYNAGSYNEAIADLYTIPSTSPLIGEVQSLADKWQRDWSDDQSRFTTLEEWLKVDDILGARTLAQEIGTPYWQGRARSLLSEAQDRVGQNQQAKLREAQEAQQQAENAAKQAAREKAQAEERLREQEPLQPGCYYRVISESLNVRNLSPDGTISDPFETLSSGDLVRVTGNTQESWLSSEDKQVTWAEIDDPFPNGWISRGKIDGPVNNCATGPLR